jgi:hypothetical protein
MAGSSKRNISKKIGGAIDREIGFALEGSGSVSSPVKAVPGLTLGPPAKASAVVADQKSYSPEFLLLAEPTLPDISRTYRARLLMQSPTRLYFYWDTGKNPFHTLSRAVGGAGNYTLVLKLVDLRSGAEEIHPVNAAGDWWFDVNPNSEYRAEIGFYAVNRPYIRVLYSNVAATPRRSPSPRAAERAEWRVQAGRFARVLDAAGFARDAFDVAIAGDDVDAAGVATMSAFAEFSGQQPADFAGFETSELRYAMLALAAGASLVDLRGLVSEGLFALLSSLSDASGDRAMAALKDRFEFDAEEFELEGEADAAVYGTSLVNFPRKVKNLPVGGRVPGSRPVSSPVRSG